MTNEIFEALVPYEAIFDRVKARQYQPYPGLKPLQAMLAAIKETRPHYKANLGCSSCVRSMVLEAAGLYYTEKAAREAAKTAVEPETPTEPSPAPAPKKKARKTKKTTE